MRVLHGEGPLYVDIPHAVRWNILLSYFRDLLLATWLTYVLRVAAYYLQIPALSE